jgi:hypothetical protein
VQSGTKNFKEDIALHAKFGEAEVDLTATIDPKVWKTSEPRKAELYIKATDKAKAGEYTIHVTGKPTKGEPTIRRPRLLGGRRQT